MNLNPLSTIYKPTTLSVNFYYIAYSASIYALWQCSIVTNCGIF